MALIECPKCKAKVSDKAYDCPKCGHQFASGSKKTNVYLLPAVIVVGCLGIFLVYKTFFTGNLSVNKMQRLTEERSEQFKALEEQRKKVADVDTETVNNDVDMKIIELEKTKKIEEERIARELEQTKRLLDIASEQQAQQRMLDAQRQQGELEKLRQEEELKGKENANQVAAAEGDILSLSEVDIQPVAIYNPGPVVPLYIRSNISSNITLMFSLLIDSNGDVESVRLLKKSDNADLDAMLISHLKTWKYQPATKNNMRVKVWKTVPISIKK